MAVWQSITYECLQTRAILVEPLLCLEGSTPFWVSQESPTEWRTTYDVVFDQQHVPISFWIGYKKHYDEDWHATTVTIDKPDEGTCEYTVRIGNKPESVSPDLVMIYNVNSYRRLNETKMYGYTPTGRLIEVKDFSNFMHLGPKTDADIALAAAAEDG